MASRQRNRAGSGVFVEVPDGILLAEDGTPIVTEDGQFICLEYWTPAGITTEAWYDATQGITSSNNSVSQWNDLSGNGNDLTQDTAADQPVIGSYTQDGKQTVSFDGTSDVMISTAVTNPASFTRFIALRNNTTTSVHLVNTNPVPNGGTILTLQNDELGLFRGSFINDGATFGDGDLGAISAVFNSTSSELYLDGADAGSGDVGTGSASGLIIGGQASGTVNSQIDVFEYIQINRVPTVAERQRIEGYLAWKWGFQDQLDSDHPYRYDGREFGYNKLWTPSEITSQVWLDADAPSTITESSGSVSQWDDKSGNDNHATQSTGNLQPEVGVNTIGGLQTISNRNSSKTMDITNSPDVVACFAVVKCASAGSSTVVVLGSDSNGTTPSAEVLLRKTADQISFDGTGTKEGRYSANGGAVSDYDIGHNESEIDGDVLFYGEFESPAVSLANIIGRSGLGTDATGNDIGEIIWLNSTPTDAERQKIEGYLAHKWGLTANLPSDHPYKTEAPTA